MLAAQADERWAAKPRVMDAPAGDARVLESGVEQLEAQNASLAEEVKAERRTRRGAGGGDGEEKDPWKSWERAKDSTPGWQPQAWKPGQGGNT